MADNYLEKKMDELRSAPRRVFRPARKVRAVFVRDGLSQQGREAVEHLAADATVAVAFAGDNRGEGMKLAQRVGARFYPLSESLTLDQALADARARYAPLPLQVI